jgi:hypothetical protein
VIPNQNHAKSRDPSFDCRALSISFATSATILDLILSAHGFHHRRRGMLCVLYRTVLYMPATTHQYMSTFGRPAAGFNVPHGRNAKTACISPSHTGGDGVGVGVCREGSTAKKPFETALSSGFLLPQRDASHGACSPQWASIDPCPDTSVVMLMMRVCCGRRPHRDSRPFSAQLVIPFSVGAKHLV